MTIEFNNAQLEAVRHVHGPMMVLAGPGSGKTAVITGRLENLITKAGIPAENILVVTFSKKAALEMEKRFSDLKLKIEKKPSFGTFHSIFYSIIRNSASSHVSVITEQKKYNFIRTALESINAEFDFSTDFFASIISEISNVKGNFLDINGYAPSSLPKEIFLLIYRKYEAYLRANRLLDFDDMLLECYRLLASDAHLLKKWQNKYRYILIDEFQDINLIQYETVRLLAGDTENVFAVGDDDQSIYGFRGARPELMKRFIRDYTGAKTILLDINYRSSGKIIEAAGKVIRRNTDRFSKNIRPPAGKKAGEDIRISGFEDIKAEADFVIKEIRRLKGKGLALSDIALLFRNNADMDYISKRLEDAGIEFSGKTKENNFYRHFICRDIAAYIRAAFSYPSCALSDILLIMNRPLRYISREALSYGEAPFPSMKLRYAANRRMMPIINKFENDLKRLRTLSPFAAVKYIRKVIGYDLYLEEYAKENTADIKKYEEVLKRLEKEAKGIPTLSAWLGYIDKNSAGNGAGASDTANKGSVSRADSHSFAGILPKDAVNIMTIHASKGLEWEAVFIPLCNDSIIPGKNESTLSSLEEERRILYVAMTRAKNYLYISYAEKMHDKKAKSSRFIKVLRER